MSVTKKQKLELTWIGLRPPAGCAVRSAGRGFGRQVGKENRPRLEPRILLEDPEKLPARRCRRSRGWR